MSAADPVQHIPPSARVAGEPTPGMVREQAIAVAGLWAGVAHTEPGMTSGWHHHGAHETSIYIASGSLRMESGPGDFVYVPPGVVHREGNPGSAPSLLVVVRAGTGPTTVNVAGPASEG